MMDASDAGPSMALTILKQMSEGVVAVDLQGRVLLVNAAAAELVGTEAIDDVRGPMDEVIAVAATRKILRDTLEDSQERRDDFKLVQGQKERFVEQRTTPLRDDSGSVCGAFVMLDEVTDLRRLEAIRRRFVANVSHELKTPITAIRGMVETIRRWMRRPRDASSVGSTISRCACR